MVFSTPFSRENQQPGFSISGTLTGIIQSVHETPKAMIIETYPNYLKKSSSIAISPSEIYKFVQLVNIFDLFYNTLFKTLDPPLYSDRLPKHNKWNTE